MTRRERLERKVERREEWADKAKGRSSAAFDRAHQATAGIPFGQPILVGHHSEKRHRAALKRSDQAMRRGCDESDKAKHHESKAAGLSAQLDRTIFSDDPDAIEQLREKVAHLERQRDRMKALNAAWRKCSKPAPDDTAGWAKVAEAVKADPGNLEKVRLSMARDPLNRGPFPSYALTNIGSTIRTAKERIKDIQRRAKRTDEAEAAGGVLIDHPDHVHWCSVTFAEKPERSILNALKLAGFHWSGRAWHGTYANLPECVKSLQ